MAIVCSRNKSRVKRHSSKSSKGKKFVVKSHCRKSGSRKSAKKAGSRKSSSYKKRKSPKRKSRKLSCSGDKPNYVKGYINAYGSYVKPHCAKDAKSDLQDRIEAYRQAKKDQINFFNMKNNELQAEVDAIEAQLANKNRLTYGEVEELEEQLSQAKANQKKFNIANYPVDLFLRMKEIMPIVCGVPLKQEEANIQDLTY